MVFEGWYFRVHSIQRMYQRNNITELEVRYVIATGGTVEDYPADTLSSRLLLWLAGQSPLHVVVADNFEEKEML